MPLPIGWGGPSKSLSIQNEISTVAIVIFYMLILFILMPRNSGGGVVVNPALSRSPTAPFVPIYVFITSWNGSKLIQAHRRNILEAKACLCKFEHMFLGAKNYDDPYPSAEDGVPTIGPRGEELDAAEHFPFVQGRQAGLRRAAAKRLRALKWMMENTTNATRWMMSIDDDTAVNWRVLPEAVEELERRGDPLTQFIAAGNCISVPPVVLPQGGSGWIASRALVREMSLRLGSEGYSKALWDDWGVGNFWRKIGEPIGWKPWNWTSGRFAGHGSLGGPGWLSGGRNQNLRALYRREWAKVEPCPDLGRIEQRTCAPFLAPVRDMLVYHPVKWALGVANYGRWFFEQPTMVRYVTRWENQNDYCWNGSVAEGRAWRVESRQPSPPFWENEADDPGL